MANQSVAAGKVGVYEKTLTANTVDKVTFADDVRRFEVFSDGAAPLYISIDAADPAVGDAGAHYLPAYAGKRELESTKDGATVVRLISAGAVTYSVYRVDT